MELVTYDVVWKQSQRKPITIVPIGDIQWTGKRGATSLDILRRTIDAGLEADAHYLGVGDIIDFMSPSNRQRLEGAGFYDTSRDVVDDKAMELVHEIYELALKPTKGRWLGMLEGHHFSQLKSGDTTDMRLCQMLGARFLGTSAYVRLLFSCSGKRGNCVILCHHGVGGSGTAASPLNKLEKWAAGWEGADIVIMGHACKSATTVIQKPYPRWHGRNAPDLINRTVTLVSCGGFAASYKVGSKQGQVPRGGYAEIGMMNPIVLGTPQIHIHPRMEYHTKGKGNDGRQWTFNVTVEV